MQLLYHNRDGADAGLAGPWNSGLAIGVGYIASADEAPHYHRAMREVCVVAAGSADLMVVGGVRRVEPGVAAIVEAGEVHAWRVASPDFRMVVIHDPWVAGDTHLVAEV
jgi:quercetin dioxygenase-like cupin family protein